MSCSKTLTKDEVVWCDLFTCVIWEEVRFIHTHVALPLSSGTVIHENLMDLYCFINQNLDKLLECLDYNDAILNNLCVLLIPICDNGLDFENCELTATHRSCLSILDRVLNLYMHHKMMYGQIGFKIKLPAYDKLTIAAELMRKKCLTF